MCFQNLDSFRSPNTRVDNNKSNSKGTHLRIHEHEHDVVTPEQLAPFNKIQNVARSIQMPANVYRPDLRFPVKDLEKQLNDYTLRSTRSSSSLTSQTMSTMPQTEDTLPPKRGSRLYRALRWRSFTTYYRLFSVAILANLGAWAYINCRLIRRAPAIFQDPSQNYSIEHQLMGMLTAVSANLVAAIIMRNEHFVNFLFRVFVVHVPPTTPLRVRRVVAKVYCYGGVHSGGGLMAGLWYTSFTVGSVYDSIRWQGDFSFMDRLNLALTGLNWFLFVVIISAAHPRVRSYMHDYFEASHRFCGWVLLVSFWLQTILFNLTGAFERHEPFGLALTQIPTFWMLLILTALIIYPWLRATHNFKVHAEKLSNHATRIHFKTSSIMPPCRVIRVSDNICRETHAFATIPEPAGKPGFSVIISNAGDWTRRMIDSPPERLSIKGSPTWGVLRIATMFRPAVIVATGSGIGPCIGLFNGCPNLKCRVLWSTRNPEETYGKAVVDIVRRADPEAQIYDSNLWGRLDLAQLAYNMYKESQAEAVIVISNKNLTSMVVRKLECRGVPAFGPIWDS
ncbi:hypothetical protein Vi05172_g5738 [Venturia inaequalis]|uniref:Nonribosomal peptide synthetase 12 n=2 Tax=Venturia inaequalis TaxID=5025 RepID=A0A8H3VJ69_VENIN|nr:hypothetical protein EG327_003260 [Venturia inaequalis]RDI84314.1 hypothetical protein Vi05172_g5738 [Venturia inaequalis]